MTFLDFSSLSIQLQERIEKLEVVKAGSMSIEMKTEYKGEGMEILKQGEVIFRNGQIVEINGFKTEGMNASQLKDYVFNNYLFLNLPEDEEGH